MLTIDVKNLKNETVGKTELKPEVFGVELNETLIWEAIKHFLACKRAGTHSTKTRGDVKGSTRKPWRQKGTGRARAGDRRSPLWRHGGTVFGPKPRSYAYTFPKKKKRAAMRCALSERLRNNELFVVDSLTFESHKTKEFVNVMKNFGIDRKLLVIDDGLNNNLYLSTRNIPGVKFVEVDGLNIYDVVHHNNIMFSLKAIEKVQEVLSK